MEPSEGQIQVEDKVPSSGIWQWQSLTQHPMICLYSPPCRLLVENDLNIPKNLHIHSHGTIEGSRNNVVLIVSPITVNRFPLNSIKVVLGYIMGVSGL